MIVGIHWHIWRTVYAVKKVLCDFCVFGKTKTNENYQPRVKSKFFFKKKTRYFITDGVVTPPSLEQHFVEKLVRLPHTYFPMSHRFVYALEPLSSELLQQMREQTQLPRDASTVVFGNLQSISKISASALERWCRIAAAVDDSVLWLLKPGASSAAARMRERCVRSGLASDRLIWARALKPDSHVLRLQLIDLYLDSGFVAVILVLFTFLFLSVID